MRADPRIPVLRAPPDHLRPGDALLLPPDAPAPPGHPVARFAAPVARFAAPVAPFAAPVAPFAAPTHASGCACCLPRGEAARTLGRLFLARARGEVPFFARVVAVLPDAAWADAAWADIVRAVQGDVIASARFRLGDAGPAA